MEKADKFVINGLTEEVLQLRSDFMHIATGSIFVTIKEI
jgi:hypothetical protein